MTATERPTLKQALRTLRATLAGVNYKTSQPMVELDNRTHLAAHLARSADGSGWLLGVWQADRLDHAGNVVRTYPLS